jgi:Starch binding domain
MACEGFCKVIWSLEMKETNGICVYLTGETDALGCWNPYLAIPFSPSLQMANLWEIEIMVILLCMYLFIHFNQGRRHNFN